MSIVSVSFPTTSNVTVNITNLPRQLRSLDSIVIAIYYSSTGSAPWNFDTNHVNTSLGLSTSTSYSYTFVGGSGDNYKYKYYQAIAYVYYDGALQETTYGYGTRPALSTPTITSTNNNFDRGIQTFWSSVSGADYYTLAYYRTSWQYVYDIYATSYSLTNLYYDTQYTLSVQALNSYNNSSSFSGYAYRWTRPKTPNRPDSTNIAETSVTLTTTISSGSFNDQSRSHIEFGWSISGSGSWTTQLVANTSGNAVISPIGLQDGTNYQARCRSYSSSSGFYSYTYSSIESFSTLPYPPSAFTNPSVVYDNTSTYVSWGASSTTGVTYYLEVSYDGGSTYPNVYSTGTNTYYNINVGNNTQVRFRVRALKNSVYSSYVYSSNFIVQFTVDDPTSVTVNQPGATVSVDIYYQWGANNTGVDIRWGTDQINWNDYPNQQNDLYPLPNYNFGVGSGGEKYFQVRGRRNVGGTNYLGSWINATPYPIDIVDRPDNWAWSYTIASGQPVYSVSGKNIYIMPYTEWNSFTTRINEFRTYKSLSSYAFTTLIASGEVTKEIVNEALNAIRDLSAYFTGGNVLIANRITGDNILEANIYTNMRDCLNSIA